MNRALVLGVAVVGIGAFLWSRRGSSSDATIDAVGLQLEEWGEDVVNAVTPGWEPPARAAHYLGDIRAAEQRYGIPNNMLARLLYQESRFRPDIISGATVSSAGALGIAQFMPATAAELGVDPLNPASAIDGAGKYLRRLFDQVGGDWSLALASYNWGIGNVQRRGLAQAPAETRNYVAGIMGDLGYA